MSTTLILGDQGPQTGKTTIAIALLFGMVEAHGPGSAVMFVPDEQMAHWVRRRCNEQYEWPDTGCPVFAWTPANIDRHGLRRTIILDGISEFRHADKGDPVELAKKAQRTFNVPCQIIAFY